MNVFRKSFPALIVIMVLIVSSLITRAQESELGKVEFQTSGSAEAQKHFLRGLAALHSFWYEVALEAFQEAVTVDPDFMMGYWGQAMAYNHPLWSEQDTAAARLVIAKIKDTPKLTTREKAYLSAVKVLYGEGDKDARDAAYSSAMEQVYGDYPDDLDAAAFYSLSLLGIVDYQDKSYRLQAKAGAIALAAYEKNPNHPGAAHYIIHAFDDPDHAILALPAARRYATIAPEAHHARHMPSHIFLQLGMWPEAAASNESAWESSDAWMKRKNLPLSVRDYHSLHWLLYVYLQQGRYTKAEALLTIMRSVMTGGYENNKLRPGYFKSSYANMAAAFVVETERWKIASGLFEQSKPGATAATQESAVGGHGGHDAKKPDTSMATVRASNSKPSLSIFIEGLAEANTDQSTSRQRIAQLKEMLAGADANKMMVVQICQLEIEAVSASMKKNHPRAIELMKRAVFLEDEMGPPSGPPGLIKPPHELYGEILLKAGKPKLAAEQFKLALLREPNRARSLIGAARAAMQSGDRNAASTFYTQLLNQWKQADDGLPELSEAREFLTQSTR